MGFSSTTNDIGLEPRFYTASAPGAEITASGCSARRSDAAPIAEVGLQPIDYYQLNNREFSVNLDTPIERIQFGQCMFK